MCSNERYVMVVGRVLVATHRGLRLDAGKLSPYFCFGTATVLNTSHPNGA
jgi:hypothetical protein